MNLPAPSRSRAVPYLALLTVLALTATLAGCGGDNLPAPKAGQALSGATPALAIASAARSVASAAMR